MRLYAHEIAHCIADVLHARAAIGMQAIFVDEPGDAAGDALDEQQLLAQLLGSTVLVGHVLHHSHHHLYAITWQGAANARPHPTHIAIRAAPAVLHIQPLAALAHLVEHMAVFRQDAADRALRIHPFLLLKPGDVAQAGGPQQHRFARVFNAAPVARARQAFHGVEDLGLLTQLAAHFLQ
ncbi:hypothetical protein D3C71_1557720 [compost metagenome]